ncbi:kinetochore Sim4 complex subunit Fta4 [Sordaria brevicollis]|uniref:Kinetochore Sim4 complex subunit Fta4 n=1 Tax=Sordaria brevicollis TaxID=83679 RepID=A0AAE0UGN5_SORBR|nr:kinetochore Sim4 complex subunit Fta4 [Sordaria brevicollis]
MSQPPPTLLALKSSFLTTQTRTLSQPLAPTRAYLLSSQNEEDQQGIPQKPLSEALTKLNHRLTQHNRRAYPPQATRHVAEQIDKLYFSYTSSHPSSSHPETGEEDDEDSEKWRELNADLTQSKLIRQIPDSWSAINEKEAGDNPMEVRRFEELVSQLKELDERKQKVLERVGRLRRLKGLVEGFESSPTQEQGAEGTTEGEGEGQKGGIKAVQENLVTKNGEMETELQRMRVLLARVGGRVEKLDKERADKDRGRRKRSREGDDEGAGADERRKVEKLLGSF